MQFCMDFAFPVYISETIFRKAQRSSIDNALWINSISLMKVLIIF